MKTFELQGSVREVVGKKPTKVVRKSDMVPCVLYGGTEIIHFEVSQSNVRKLIYSPEVFVVGLTIGEKSCMAIMKDLQFHPVSDKVLHIDFLEVFESKPITIKIPVKLEGLAIGVKQGGKLIQEMRTLKVRATYDKIPENLVVNVTKIKLGKSIQVGALSFPGLEILSPTMNIVATVKLTRAAKGAAAAAIADNIIDETEDEATEESES